QPEREIAPRHEGERDGESEDVEHARVDEIRRGTAHEVVEVPCPLGVDPHLLHSVGEARQLSIPLPTTSLPTTAGAGIQRRGVDRGEGGEVGEILDLLAGGSRSPCAHAAHFPTMFWPHTRRVSPWMPPASSLARKAIVSATSTGSPPCWSEFTRRAISRVSGGIFAVISVSMKPGATAFAVPPSGASRAASASTKAMTPAFEAA